MRPSDIPGIEFIEATDADVIQQAKRLEFDIFSQTGYEGTTGIIEEYEKYPSKFFVAISSGRVIGVIRKIQPSEFGFTTTGQMELDPIWAKQAHKIQEQRKCEEGATTAVLESYRAKNRFSVVLNLFRLILEDAVRNDVTHWFAPIEPAVYQLYTRIFGVSFDQIGPIQEYLGAPTIPCMADIRFLIDGVYAKNQELGTFFTENLPDNW